MARGRRLRLRARADRSVSPPSRVAGTAGTVVRSADAEALAARRLRRRRRLEQYRRVVEDEQRRLEAEAAAHGDLLLVPEVDVYRFAQLRQ